MLCYLNIQTLTKDGHQWGKKIKKIIRNKEKKNLNFPLTLMHDTLSNLTSASLWIMWGSPDWVKQNSCGQIAVSHHDKNNRQDLASMYSIKSQHAIKYQNALSFVCTERQRSWAGCAESEVDGNHEKILHISDQRALVYHRVSLNRGLPGVTVWYETFSVTPLLNPGIKCVKR